MNLLIINPLRIFLDAILKNIAKKKKKKNTPWLLDRQTHRSLNTKILDDISTLKHDVFERYVGHGSKHNERMPFHNLQT